MALDFIKNLFLSEEKKAKISHILSLATTLMADGKIEDEEVVLLRAIAKREGLSDEETNDILKGKKSHVKFTAPKDEDQKVQYLKDIAAMMIIDGNINAEELKLCVLFGKRLGLPAETVSEVITGITRKFLEAKQNATTIMSEKPEMNNQETVTTNNKSSSKLARPKFTDEEAFAMGTLALSLADINQGTAMMVFMHEYEGYTAGDVKQIMANATTDIPKALSIFMRMSDPFKKSYAAGFFASLIKASGAMDDTESIRVWRNCIETALHHQISFADAIKWYESSEHGKK